jgi:hypothetical protein
VPLRFHPAAHGRRKQAMGRQSLRSLHRRSSNCRVTRLSGCIISQIGTTAANPLAGRWACKRRCGSSVQPGSLRSQLRDGSLRHQEKLTIHLEHASDRRNPSIEEQLIRLYKPKDGVVDADGAEALDVEARMRGQVR